MNTNEDTSIYEFEEKPANPKSNLASMGVYIFDWKMLKGYFEEVNNGANYDDFGKNLIPNSLASLNISISFLRRLLTSPPLIYVYDKLDAINSLG